MTDFVLDKNPSKTKTDNFTEVKKVIEQNTLNSILCYEPFLKTSFITQLISKYDIPVIYLDFDLLFSGYFTSNTTLPDLTLFNPTYKDWNETFKKISQTLSIEKSILIIDSLNGFFNLFDNEKDVGRLVNCYVMLLVCLAKMSKSLVFLISMAKQKDEEGWTLTTTGRRIVETNEMTQIQIQRQNSNILLKIIDDHQLRETTFKISIDSELI